MTTGDKKKRKKRTPAEVLDAFQSERSRLARQHVIRTVDGMLARGEKITFAAVMRESGRSRWLVYQDELADYIRTAKQSQDGPRWLDDWDNDDDEALYE